ncbi:unnamed protein product [Parascedosporium putredinis]|uniref:Vacuolar protein sorting protein 11 C-terminal domain-containing protein n=1 Tax=Parascedosporium putredinis TaxID=1442378 RepID=A0A9P1ME36_9PEZI|nr:unnamed protein product [Parascedosporium putredinis]CAI7999727.1 unnamed protein product [Parascedosporium putredinis]
MTQDGKVNRYHQRSLQQRLEMLYQRNMFPLALELAQSAGMDSKQQSTIYKRFGDHLYQKGDYDAAMVQYIRAIDTTEPSQVIRKYLEQLHEHRKATSDHTTLLLNCYAKLKDIEKLEAFIKSPGDLNLPRETAREIDLVVDILVEDSKNYDEALNFIWQQDPETAYSCLMKYARVLIEHCPQDATQLFVDYYTGKFRPKPKVIMDLPLDDTEAAAAAAAAQGGLAMGAANAMQNFAGLIALPYRGVGANAAAAAGEANGNGTAAAAVEEGPAPEYTAPAPRTAFSSFIDHPDEFIIFLESCLEPPGLSKSDKTDLYTTLFEMYLHKASEKKGEHREEWEAKAKKLIAGSDIPMESSSVLLLSDLSGFKDGTILVKEQAGLLFDIFRSYTSAKDTRGAMKALRKYGPEEPQLYPAALAYLTSQPQILDEAGPDELAGVLDKIDKDGLMAPLQVIQTMMGQGGGDGVATMGMIKPYLHDIIERERREIASNRRRIAAFRTETEQKRGELTEISTRPAVFQATRFHQRCLRGGGAGPEAECPLCAKDNATIRALRKSQAENADKHGLFKNELERSEDRFATVADCQLVDPRASPTSRAKLVDFFAKALIAFQNSQDSFRVVCSLPSRQTVGVANPTPLQGATSKDSMVTTTSTTTAPTTDKVVTDASTGATAALAPSLAKPSRPVGRLVVLDSSFNPHARAHGHGGIGGVGVHDTGEFPTEVGHDRDDDYGGDGQKIASSMQAALGPFFDEARLRITLREGGGYGAIAEQRAYLDGLAGGGLEAVGGLGEWAGRLEAVEGEGTPGRKRPLPPGRWGGR